MIGALIARPFLLKAGLALGGVAVLGAGVQTYRLSTTKTELAELQRDLAEAENTAREAKSTREQELRTAIETARDALRRQNDEATQQLTSTLGALRAESIRLRSRFQCPPAADLSGTPAGAPGDHGAETGGLSGTDAEFLVRLAAEADRNTRQLAACQATLRSERKQ